MLYKDLDMEEARKRFEELTVTVPVEEKKAAKPKRKVVKAVVPKSK